MSSQLLVNVLRVPAGSATLAENETVTIAHGLITNERATAPKLIQPDRATTIVVESVTDTEVTFRNAGTAAAFAFFRFEIGLSNEVEYDTLTPSYWQGAASGGGGGGGTVTAVTGTAPITSTGGNTPAIGLNYEAANFVVSAGKLDLTTTVDGAAGEYGGPGTAGTQSLMPVFTVDPKGRLIGVAQQAINIGGTTAKNYVDQGDADTLAAAEAYAQSLAFGIATKAPAHVATTVALPTCVADGTFQTLTKTTPGIFPDIDGEEVVVGERVLVKNEGNAANNGLYVLTTKGTALVPWVLTRTADADTGAKLCGSLVTVQTGGTQAGSVWIFAANPGDFDLGVDPVEWTSLQVAEASASVTGTVRLTPNSGIGGAGSSAVDVKLHVGASGVGSGTLPANHGGTGQDTYTGGELLVGAPGNTLSKLTVGAAGTVLKGGATPSWAQVDAGTDITGVLPAVNGGTGLAGSGVDATKFLKANGAGGWELSTAATPGQTAIKNVLFVTTTGSDATGDGSIAKPFATIQGAHDWAATNIPVLDPVLISVAPGSYAGANLSRLNTFVQGAATKPEENAATKISGLFSIAPVAGGSKYGTQISVSGFFVDGGASLSAISASGSVEPAAIVVTNCYLTNSSTSEPVVNLNNSAAKFLFYSNVINAQAAGTYGINTFNVAGGDIRASDNYILQPGISGGAGTALTISSSAYGLFDRTIIESKLATCVTVEGTTPVAVPAGGYKFILANSSVSSTSGSGKGVVVTATATGGRFAALITDTTFGVANKTIEVIAPSSAALVAYANLSCLPGTTPVLTAGMTPANEAHGSVMIPSLTTASAPLRASSTKVIETGAIDLDSADVTGVLPVDSGGTGLSAVTQYGILYGDTATTMAVLAPGTSGKVLTTKGVGFPPEWTTSAVGTVVSVELDMGTTGLTVNGSTTDTITSSGSFDIAGKLAIGSGGTNATGIGGAGSVAYSTGTAYAFSGAGTVGSILLSGGAGAPTWASVLSMDNGGTGNSVVPVSGSVPYSDGTKLVYTAAGPDGYVLRSNSGTPYWDVNTAVPTGPVTPPGDLTGNYPSPTVARINGVSVPAGPITIGTVLVADTTSSATWGQLNLGAAGVAGPGVTGVLPKANQQAQDMGTSGGDVTGTTANATVTKVQGNLFSASVPTVGQVPTWNGTQFVYAVPSGGGGGGGGGGGAIYYFDSSQAGQAPVVGLNVPTKQMTQTEPVTGGSLGPTALVVGSYTTAAAFVTNTNVPELSAIPAGLWDFNVWAQATGVAGEVFLRPSLYSYNGTTPTLIASGAPVYLLSPAVSTLLEMQMLIPAGTTLLETDRLYVVFEAEATTAGRTITLSFGDGTPSHVHTTLPVVSGTGFVQVFNDVVQPTAAKIPLGDSAYVDGTLATTHGGTGLATAAYSPGDMLYYSTGAALTRLGIGGSNQYLRVSALGAPEWTSVTFGNVQEVFSTNNYLTVATSTTNPTLTLHVGKIVDTVAAGNDDRFNPNPTTAGRVVYGTTTGYAVSDAGLATEVLHGGPNPSFSSINLNTDTSGALNITRGGTGLSSGTAGDTFFWPASGTSLSTLSIGNAGTVMVSDGTGPSWSSSLLITSDDVFLETDVRFVTKPDTETVSGATYTFPSTSAEVKIIGAPAGPPTILTSTPTITRPPAGRDGARLTIVNATDKAVVFQDESQLPGSGIQLGGPGERLVGPFQAINFVYMTYGATGFWVETSVGGSGTVQSVNGSGLVGVTSGANPTVSLNGFSSTPTVGGIPYFDTTTSMQSSAALAANRLVLGGGGSGPSSLAAGTNNLVLTGVTGAAPTWSLVNLGNSVAGVLPVAYGGTNNAAAPVANELVYAASPTAYGYIPTGASGTVLKGNGAGSPPAFGSVSLTTDVSGVLPIANGGTGDGSTVAINTVFAGPASGGAGAPSYRALVADDIPTFAATTSLTGPAKVTAIPYDIAGSAAGTPNPSSKIFFFKAVRSCTIPAATGTAPNQNHKAGVATAPGTGAVTFTILKNGSSVGSFDISTTGLATFTVAADVNLVPGDLLTVEAPAALDGLQDVYFTFVATVD